MTNQIDRKSIEEVSAWKKSEKVLKHVALIIGTGILAGLSQKAGMAIYDKVMGSGEATASNTEENVISFKKAQNG